MNSEYLTIKEVAEHFRISPSLVHVWINRGRIPFFKDTGIIRIPISGMLAFEIKNSHKPKQVRAL